MEPVDTESRSQAVDHKYHDVEVVTARDADSELVKVFLRSHEKNQLKKLALDEGVALSHLIRVVLLKLLEGD